MPRLSANEFFLTSDEQYGSLTLAFTRYRPLNPVNGCDAGRTVALIFAHNVTTHKETWQPTIEHLFDLQSASPTDKGLVVEEAWVVDSPNHGHSAVLNDEALLKRPGGISGYEWGRAVQKLIGSSLINSRYIIGVGHSAGAAIMVLSTMGYSLSSLPYKSIILVEPGMMTPKVFAATFNNKTELFRMTQAAKTRKDIWPSREAASEWFNKRLPWKRWDPRVFELFIEHSLRPLPTGTYPSIHEGVTLTCTREQETVGYVYYQDAMDSVERITDLCKVMNVHCILGSKIDLVSQETHDGVCDEKEGRKMATMTVVQGCGHLVVQEDPNGLARALKKVLDFETDDNGQRHSDRSKL